MERVTNAMSECVPTAPASVGAWLARAARAAFMRPKGRPSSRYRKLSGRPAQHRYTLAHKEASQRLDELLSLVDPRIAESGLGRVMLAQLLLQKARALLQDELSKAGANGLLHSLIDQ